jgi:hypothetical protein
MFYNGAGLEIKGRYSTWNFRNINADAITQQLDHVSILSASITIAITTKQRIKILYNGPKL